MSDRIGEDALLDVGCFLDRFEVDSIQGLTWKSHTYLANKTHILPVRLLGTARIGGKDIFVPSRAHTRSKVLNFNGSRGEAFQLGLAAIKDSDLNGLSIQDEYNEPITEEDAECFAAVAPSVKVGAFGLSCEVRHLSPQVLRRLMFSLSSVKELTVCGFTGNQLTDDDLRECGQRHIERLYFTTKRADPGPLAVSDEAMLDYLFTPEYEMRKREAVLSASKASPFFVQKLINRAQQATNVDRVDLDVKHLPLGSQQLVGMRLTVNQGLTEYREELENGAHITLKFGRKPPLDHREAFFKQEYDDQFRFELMK